MDKTPNAGSIDALESALQVSARAYVVAARTGDTADLDNYLNELCSTFEYLLHTDLTNSIVWTPYRWIDGINPATDMLPDAVGVSENTITVRGSALWADGNGPFWIEPFRASLHFSDDVRTLNRYDLNFGNKATGLAKTRYDAHIRRVNWFYPEQWLFAISRTRHPSAVNAL